MKKKQNQFKDQLIDLINSYYNKSQQGTVSEKVKNSLIPFLITEFIQNKSHQQQSNNNCRSFDKYLKLSNQNQSSQINMLSQQQILKARSILETISNIVIRMNLKTCFGKIKRNNAIYQKVNNLQNIIKRISKRNKIEAMHRIIQIKKYSNQSLLVRGIQCSAGQLIERQQNSTQNQDIQSEENSFLKYEMDVDEEYFQNVKIVLRINRNKNTEDKKNLSKLRRGFDFYKGLDDYIRKKKNRVYQAFRQESIKYEAECKINTFFCQKAQFYNSIAQIRTIRMRFILHKFYCNYYHNQQKIRNFELKISQIYKNIMKPNFDVLKDFYISRKNQIAQKKDKLNRLVVIFEFQHRIRYREYFNDIREFAKEQQNPWLIKCIERIAKNKITLQTSLWRIRDAIQIQNKRYFSFKSIKTVDNKNLSRKKCKSQRNFACIIQNGKQNNYLSKTRAFITILQNKIRLRQFETYLECFQKIQLFKEK